MRWENRMQKQIFVGMEIKLFLSLCAFIGVSSMRWNCTYFVISGALR